MYTIYIYIYLYNIYIYINIYYNTITFYILFYIFVYYYLLLSLITYYYLYYYELNYACYIYEQVDNLVPTETLSPLALSKKTLESSTVSLESLKAPSEMSSAMPLEAPLTEPL